MHIQVIYSYFYEVFFFFVFSRMNSLWVLDFNLLTRNVICKYFLPFHRLPFHFVDCFLCSANTLVWCIPTCLFWLLLHVILVSKLPPNCQDLHQGTSLFSCRIFIVWGLRFKLYIHLDRLFVYGIQKRGPMHSFACRNPICPAIFVEETNPIVHAFFFFFSFLGLHLGHRKVPG